MKILHCPLNGPRNISEFAYLGEVKSPPAHDTDIAAWAEYVFVERNPAGPVREWWIHTATNYVFVVDRDTRTDEIFATYPIGDPRLKEPVAPGRDN